MCGERLRVAVNVLAKIALALSAHPLSLLGNDATGVNRFLALDNRAMKNELTPAHRARSANAHARGA